MEKQTDGQRQKFCRTYLRTMDADQAAAAAGYQDGYARLRTEPIRQCLRRMREAAAGELRQEDVLRQLAHLAFGRADDVLRLALRPGETELSGLDLTAVAEFKATEKGLDIKLVDRLRALELLFSLLESTSTNAAQSLYQALTKAGTEKEAWGDD